MQRWIRLPQGGFLDASQVIFISKVESYAKIDDDGHSSGTDYAVTIGIGMHRDQQMMITGNKDEIGTLVRQLLGQAPAS